MAAQLINRRKFARLIGNGLTVGSVAGVGRVASAAPRRIRVAAVQMTADLANVDADLSNAERLVRLALKRGARWIVLPEFFTSAIAFNPDMAKATEAVDGRPTELMRKLAQQGNAFVGGSFLAWHAGNVYNSFILALPNGKHSGMIRTTLPSGKLATTWEATTMEYCRLRTATWAWHSATSSSAPNRSATEAQGRHGCGRFLLVGEPGCTPADDPSGKWFLDLLNATPAQFARLLGVPVVHASHAGRFEGTIMAGQSYAVPVFLFG